MSTCLPCNATATPVPEVPALPACINAEDCPDFMETGCVIYNGPNIAILGITTGMKMNVVIQKWSEFVSSQSQAITTDNSDTVVLTGNGTDLNPIKAELVIDPVAGNLLEKTVTGAKVVLTVSLVDALLDLVAVTPALQTKFCALVANCGDQVCGIISDLNGNTA